eukprot:7192240-Heterocapsa_arctica.AAC.1
MGIYKSHALEDASRCCTPTTTPGERSVGGRLSSAGVATGQASTAEGLAETKSSRSREGISATTSPVQT